MRTTIHLDDDLYDEIKEKIPNLSKLVNNFLKDYLFEAEDEDVKAIREELVELEETIVDAQHKMVLCHQKLITSLSDEQITNKKIKRLWLNTASAIQAYWDRRDDYPVEMVHELSNALNLEPDDIDLMWDYDQNYKDNHPFDDDYVEVHNDVFLLKEKYIDDY